MVKDFAPWSWWRVEDGVAVPFPDTPEVRARIDSREPGWYGTIEGCILHGGLQACAFKRERHETYDGPHWLKTGEQKFVGHVYMTVITATPKDDFQAGRVYSHHTN